MKSHRFSVVLNEIILCLLLTYYYFYNTYIFLPTEIFSVSIATVIMIIVILSFSILVTFRHYKTFSYIEYLLIGLLILYAVLGSRITQELWFKNTPLYWGVFSVFMGIMMSRDRDLHSLVFWTPLIVVLVSIIFEIWRNLGNAMEGQIGTLNRNSFAMMASTNGMLIIMNYVIKKRLHSKLSLLFPFILLLINFYSKSRAGLLIAMTLIAFVYGNYFLRLFSRYWEIKEERKRTIQLFLFWLILILILFVFLAIKSRFNIIGMYSSGRIPIYISFLKELNYRSFITGFTPSVLSEAGHLHNSFFQLIAISGILSVPMFVIIFMAVRYLLIDRNFLVLLIGLIFAYSLVEHYMFLRYGDLILFPLIVFSFYEHRTKHRQQDIELKDSKS